MDLGITDRLAVVSGADGDIGLAAAIELAGEGVRLLLTGLDDEALADSVSKLADDHGASTETVVADLTEEVDVQRLADVAADLGGAEILVHAAGVTGAKGDPLELSDADWDHAWQIDFMSAVRMSRALVPQMVGNGWGRVVFVTSENAIQPYGDEMPYNVAKAALLNFTKGVGQVYAPKGVLINTVSPAFIETGMTDGMMEKRAEELGVSVEEAVESFLDEERPHLVLERRGRPEEVAAAIAFLCSDRASFVVGSSYRVDGGSVMAMAI